MKMEIITAFLSGGIGGFFFPLLWRWLDVKKLKVEVLEKDSLTPVFKVFNLNKFRVSIYNFSLALFLNDKIEQEWEWDKTKNVNNRIYALAYANDGSILQYVTNFEPHSVYPLRIEMDRRFMVEQGLRKLNGESIRLKLKFQANVRRRWAVRHKFNYAIEIPIITHPDDES